MQDVLNDTPRAPRSPLFRRSRAAPLPDHRARSRLSRSAGPAQGGAEPHLEPSLSARRARHNLRRRLKHLFHAGLVARPEAQRAYLLEHQGSRAMAYLLTEDGATLPCRAPGHPLHPHAGRPQARPALATRSRSATSWWRAMRHADDRARLRSSPFPISSRARRSRRAPSSTPDTVAGRHQLSRYRLHLPRPTRRYLRRLPQGGGSGERPSCAQVLLSRDRPRHDADRARRSLPDVDPAQIPLLCRNPSRRHPSRSVRHEQHAGLVCREVPPPHRCDDPMRSGST